MKRITVALIGLLFLAVGCASNTSDPTFGKKLEQVHAGMTKEAVRTQLGKPDQRIGGRAGEARPADKKVPPPVNSISAGSRYEDWSYVRDDKRFHVIFGPGKNHPGRWEVVGTHTEPVEQK
jgi:hypothetical protein